jgi:hypothetical protein
VPSMRDRDAFDGGKYKMPSSRTKGAAADIFAQQDEDNRFGIAKASSVFIKDKTKPAKGNPKAEVPEPGSEAAQVIPDAFADGDRTLFVVKAKSDLKKALETKTAVSVEQLSSGYAGCVCVCVCVCVLCVWDIC